MKESAGSNRLERGIETLYKVDPDAASRLVSWFGALHDTTAALEPH
jgi:hypothetical protein